MAAVASITTITKASILAARREFQRRCHEVEVTKIDTDIDVEIASGVSQEELEAIPEERLEGITVELCSCGTLLIVRVESSQHANAVAEVSTAVGNYKNSNTMQRLAIYGGGSYNTNPGASNNKKPDVALVQRPKRSEDEEEPLVLFEVEVNNLSCRGLVRKAAHFLRTMPSVVRVVGFKFYPPRENANRAELLDVPAIALVFERVDSDPKARIRVVSAASFGNAAVETDILTSLVRPPASSPMVPFPAGYGLALPGFDGEIRRETLHMDLSRLSSTNNQQLEVSMPPPLRSLKLPLSNVFIAAVSGWGQDHRQKNDGDGNTSSESDSDEDSEDAQDDDDDDDVGSDDNEEEEEKEEKEEEEEEPPL